MFSTSKTDNININKNPKLKTTATEKKMNYCEEIKWLTGC